MADESSIRLHNVSVVVTAEYHNPSILHPGFLVSREIVPKDWSVAEAVTTPSVSVVQYTNGITWTVNESRLTVTEACGPAFKEHYEVHGLAMAYLQLLPHVPYRGLGLNCQVSALRADPKRWLIDRFAVNWLRDDAQVQGMKPTFELNARDAVCNITFVDAIREDNPCIVVDCNVHHLGPLEVEGLQAANKRWAERQQFIVSALEKLLENPNR